MKLRKKIIYSILSLLFCFYFATLFSLFKEEKVRDYDALVSTSPKSRIDFIDSLSRISFEFKYVSYSFLHNPISYCINSIKPGLNQISDPEYLYNYHSTGFCGQQSQFLGSLANDLGLDYRYIFHDFGHVTIEIRNNEGQWCFFDPTDIIITNVENQKESTANRDFISLLNQGNLELAVKKKQFLSILGEIEYQPVNHDTFWKLKFFNGITFYIWYIGLPMVFIAVFLLILIKRI